MKDDSDREESCSQSESPVSALGNSKDGANRSSSKRWFPPAAWIRQSRRSSNRPIHLPTVQAEGEPAKRTWLVYWILFALIMIAAAVLRTYLIDMPPLISPTDRQRGNLDIAQKMIDGRSLFDFRSRWLELFVLPWVVARTHWICSVFHCQLWTLARVWSMIFGLVCVAFMAVTGMKSLPKSTTSLGTRCRFSLMMMAALAFNPYHIWLSRMITTESVTLAAQSGALAFFWLAYRDPKRKRWMFGFLAFMTLAGACKIPSLFWLPGFALYFAFHHRIGRSRKAAGLALAIVGAICVFWLYRLNPIKVYESFRTSYPLTFGQAAEWIGHPMWNRAYLGRLVHMLTLPGLVLGVLGLLVAPWLYGLTAALFLVLFYLLTNINTYNFAHIIIPGMALAVFGAHYLIESFRIRRRWLGEDLPAFARFLSPRLEKGLGLILVIAIIVLLYPIGPRKRRLIPRDEVFQGVEVIRQAVPAEATVVSGDFQGLLNYFLRRNLGKKQTPTDPYKVNLNTGYYYSFERFGDFAFEGAADSWVRWASIPGEFDGILYSRKPTVLAAEDLNRYICLNRPAQAPAADLDVQAVYLPKRLFDVGRRLVRVRAGEPFDFGVQWNNSNQVPLASLLMYSNTWGEMVAVPVREGGFGFRQGGTLCLPQGQAEPVRYTIEFPARFPIGTYAFYYYPVERDRWDTPSKQTRPMPFFVECLPSSPSLPLGEEAPFLTIYPETFTSPPTLVTPAWFYKDMHFEGNIVSQMTGHLISAPGSPAGRYRLTLRGEADPLSNQENADYNWPEVDIYLPNDPESPIASLSLSSDRTRQFAAEFDAPQPFDSIKLVTKIEGAKLGTLPAWLIDFQPAQYGLRDSQQYAMMRGVKLERIESSSTLQARAHVPRASTRMD